MLQLTFLPQMVTLVVDHPGGPNSTFKGFPELSSKSVLILEYRDKEAWFLMGGKPRKKHVILFAKYCPAHYFVGFLLEYAGL